jgi:hypothetical protein
LILATATALVFRANNEARAVNAPQGMVGKRLTYRVTDRSSAV